MRVAGLAGDDAQHLLHHRVGCGGERSRSFVGHVCNVTGSLSRNRCHCQVGPALAHEAHHGGQRRVVAQIDAFLHRNRKRFADGGERLGLLDGVNAQISFQVQVQVEHVLRVAGLARHHAQHLLHHRVGCGGERVSG